VNRRPKLSIVAPDASPEEAAAVVAAVERFMRETAPVFVTTPEPTVSAWKQAALNEGVRRAPEPTPFWA
jgi:ABC-type phosphate transport system permease subunit